MAIITMTNIMLTTTFMIIYPLKGNNLKKRIYPLTVRPIFHIYVINNHRNKNKCYA